MGWLGKTKKDDSFILTQSDCDRPRDLMRELTDFVFVFALESLQFEAMDKAGVTGIFHRRMM